MNYLFHATVIYSGDQVKYKVYEFKLFPGKFKAELATINAGNNIKEVIFWKEKNEWITQPANKNAEYVAEVIGRDIDRYKD